MTVDHGLQPGSADRATAVAALLADLGLEPVEVETVEVAGAGGPEAAARAARYDALDRAAARTGARTVLLGHTLDDQAETVLLGLARGSGTRSLAGMAATSGADGRYRRPLLGLDRATTRAACADLGLAVWDDPHNADPAFTRVRVRTGCCRCSRPSSGQGLRRPSPAPPTWPATTPTRSTAGPRPPTRRSVRRRTWCRSRRRGVGGIAGRGAPPGIAAGRDRGGESGRRPRRGSPAGDRRAA